MTERTVVHGERQVERLAREGVVAETRASLARRLLEELAPDATLASPEVSRLALDLALDRVAAIDPLLGPIARAGGAAWLWTGDAIDRAIGALRAAAVSDDALAVASRAAGTTGARARTLRAAMRAHGEELQRAGLIDGRAAGALLARAIGAASPDAVARAALATTVVARGIVTWDPADVAWWRALDLALSRRRGGARIELPAVDRLLDTTRARDPLEVIADDLARALDDSPLLSRIAAPLGDLSCEGAAPSDARTRVRICRAADATAQARAVADAVHGALAAGVPVDRIAIGLPRIDEETLAPLRRALDDAGIVAHDPRGPAPARAGLVACALDALGLAARGLPRKEVAALLRSRYLDAPALTGVPERREATARLLDLARALDETPTAREDDPLGAIVATARAFRSRGDRAEEPARTEARATLAERVGAVLARVADARTHAQHVEASRALIAALGLGPRLSAGARSALAGDAPALGIARAELRAIARDAHAWEVLVSAIDGYEAAIRRLGIADREASGESFRHHVLRVVEIGAPPLGAARAGALRMARLAELAHEELALLVVLDANDGVLPQTAVPDPLLPEALVVALREAAPLASPASHALRSSRDLASLALAAAAADQIVITCRARDDQGAEMAPAPLVAWLERNGVASRPWRASAPGDRALSLADARLAWLRASPQHGARLSPEAGRRAAVERRREAFFYDPARARDDVVGELTGSPDIARALAEDTGAERALAVTSLERVAACPFQGYAQIVLGARDRPPRGELPDVREEGTLVHAALAAAFRATALLWSARPRDAAAIEAGALAAVDALFAGELVGSPLRDVVLARARDGVRAVLAWSLADDGWDFVAAEKAFGDVGDDVWPPLRIDAEGATLLLRGRVDRVNEGHLEAHARAIDYKGNKRKALDVVADLGQTALQVPLYALVAARSLGRASADGLYVPTGARDLRPDYRPKDAFAVRWTELLAEEGGLAVIERTALGLVRSLRRGALAPIPHDKLVCRTCDARGGCRQPRFAVAPDEDETEAES